MISPELIRRYSFFAGLEKYQINMLSMLGDEINVEVGHYFFREKDELKHFYLVVEGTVDIVIGVTDRDQEQKLVEQLTGNFNMKNIPISSVRPGDIFAWSALIPPHTSTAGAKASSFCHVVAFDCEKLRLIFENDVNFAYLMTVKMAQVIRSRLRDSRIVSLAEIMV